jgi:two-component system phosphate regulon sensor histidine kinase PhoR
MKHRHLRSVILFGTIVLTCLLVVQVYWFKRAFDVTEKQFDHSVQVALKKVADSVAKDPEVRKLSSNFFFVTTNSELNDKAIGSLVKEEFLLRSLNLDYELGIYDAHDDTLVYGNYVKATKNRLLPEDVSRAQNSSAEKNFAIYFPRKQSYLAAELDIWIFSTVILLLMMGFFAYAIASLLREKKFAELKSDFINNMTHEFKTPVTNIQIAGEILKNKLGDQEGTKNYIDILLKENARLHQKIEHVLSGSYEGQLRKPAFEVMDVHQLIASCAEAFHLRLQERNGNIRLELNARSGSILGDRELLTQAINNVIDNAEKYSPRQPRITVRTTDCANGIEICVIDNGIGIPSHVRAKVFEKFFRVPSGDVHNVKGFGLGLNFVRSVIRSHRGRVSLLSELNKGTEVKIVLPTI